MSIIVVEDDLFIRMDLENRIKSFGAEVVATTATGIGAIELAKDHKPDLIFMDIKLKGEMDGVTAAGKIATFLTCNIVFISAFDKPEFNETLSNSECRVAYYSKPVADMTLKKILKDFSH